MGTDCLYSHRCALSELRRLEGQALDRMDLLLKKMEEERSASKTEIQSISQKVEEETKKVPWHWDEVHQRAFDHVKTTIARDVVLAYPDYSEVFEIYTMLPVNN